MAKITLKWPKMTQNDQKWPKMVLNVQENGPNDSSNTNTKLPDLKWRKTAKKLPKNGQNDPKMAKNYPKWPKMAQKQPKMVLNVQENGPNDASNANTKLPDLK